MAAPVRNPPAKPQQSEENIRIVARPCEPRGGGLYIVNPRNTTNATKKPKPIQRIGFIVSGSGGASGDTVWAVVSPVCDAGDCAAFGFVPGFGALAGDAAFFVRWRFRCCRSLGRVSGRCSCGFIDHIHTTPLEDSAFSRPSQPTHIRHKRSDRILLSRHSIARHTKRIHA
jgi:hypothetical protein